MSALRKIVFALIPLACFWLAIEGGLRLAGVDSSLDHEDPFVGFEASLPLFVPAEDEAGQAIFRTADNKRRFFNAQSFAQAKPEGARRVFCLGGSTTYGHPYRDSTSFCGWLREALRVIEPATTWEVVNAGGISYASYRVAALVQELGRYEPDLFVVYTGHNEFLEERTYRALRDAPAWRRWLDRRLRGLRSHAVLEAALHPSGHRGASASRDLLAAEVNARLDSSVGLDSYTRDDAMAAAIADHFERNLERIVGFARRHGTEVLLVVPADNLADCAPFKSESSPNMTEAQLLAFDEELGRGHAARRSGDVGAGKAAFARAVALDPRHAGARYELGRALLAAGERGPALRELLAARDEDVCPLRATSRLVEISREVADRLGVAHVDFPELLAEAAGPDAPPRGADWFLDHVHPTIEGHWLLARALLGELHRTGWLAIDPASAEDRLVEMQSRVRASLDDESHGVAFRNLAKVLSWAGKTQEAARSADRALELLGDDAESFFVLSVEASERDDHTRAVALLREALRLDPEWAKARLNLGVELARMGRLQEAQDAYAAVLESDPDHPTVRFNLAHVLARAGRIEEAISAYREALSRDPQDSEAREELARLERERPPMSMR